MRVSDNMTFEQVRHNVSNNRADMAELQNKAATQKRLTKPSDDPVASARILGERLDLRGTRQYKKSLESAKSFLNFTDDTLNELTGHLNRLKELALSQANDPSANKESRRVVATEVNQIYNQILAIGNRKMGDRFVFGGYKTTQPPFETNGEYKGDDSNIMIQVDKESYVSMNLPGSTVFYGENLMGSSDERQPRTAEELIKQREAKEEAEKAESKKAAEIRAPASEQGVEVDTGPENQEAPGVNIFDTIKELEISLRTNDKKGIQDSIEDMDQALEQVILSRSKVGSRVMALDGAMETLERQEIGNQSTISSLEDADIFKLVSDINKKESALQATLQTAGKIMPKSLLDFVR